MLRLLALLTLTCYSTPPPDYASIFGEDYAYAVRFLAAQQSQFEAHCPAGAAQEGMAIVFPELIRYNLLRDLLETQALSLLYVEEGSETVDFSIGHFQMKPSFVEQLEAYALAHPALAWPTDLAAYPEAQTGKAQRQARLERLKQLEWQIRYLAAFQQVCAHRFPFLKGLAAPERLRFLAAAYNGGFMHSAARIRQNADKELFPYGARYWGEQYCYAAIAVDYFQHHSPSTSPVKP